NWRQRARRFIEQVREFYKIDIELISPDQAKLEPFVKEKATKAADETGAFSNPENRLRKPLKSGCRHFIGGLPGKACLLLTR
ncbi:hypothetical protein Q6241_30500, partial [Klebsiella pneumoniae]